MFVRVFSMPTTPTSFCFGKPNEVIFLEHDWFNASEDVTKEDLIEFIKEKNYFQESKNYLIISSLLTFTISPKGD